MDTMNVDPQVAQQIADLGIRLGEAIVRNTAGVVYNKIQTVKAKNNAQETINELDEIINSLLADKNELIQIAEAYKQEFVAQQISQNDIEYITKSLIPMLKELIKQTSSNENADGATNIEKTIDG
jgi:hypothetical protein